ncbi:MAG: hypothetical protein AAGB10_04645 [Pseudomonadota bacterium]
MEQIFQLFVGIIIAAGVFAATFFAAAQTFRQAGPLRAAQAAAVILTIATMASLSLGFWTASQLFGGALALAAAAALIWERGWNRLLPLFHLAFAVAAALGLPYGAG